MVLSTAAKHAVASCLEVVDKGRLVVADCPCPPPSDVAYAIQVAKSLQTGIHLTKSVLAGTNLYKLVF